MGPLEGVKVVELGGIGPCPMCGMLLAELGATVLRVSTASAPLGLASRYPRIERFCTAADRPWRSI